MEENYIEKTVARLEHFRGLYSDRIRMLGSTIAVIRALPSEEAAMSLVAELPAAAAQSPQEHDESSRSIRPERKLKPSDKKPLPQGVVMVNSRRMGIRYKARPYENGRSLYLGTFETPDAAAAAIEKYKAERTSGKAKAAEKTPSKGKKKKTLKPAAADRTRRGVRKGIRPGSKYKGVVKAKLRSDGTHAWKAVAYKNGKNHFLGQFEIEEQAALAVAKFKGDTAEVRRLSDMAEQIENNPSRPGSDARCDYETTEEPKMVYRCKHCKLEYQSRPQSCVHCNSAAFDEVKNSSK